MKFLILKNNRSKEVRKVFEKKLEKEQKGKERHSQNIFYNEAFLKRTKRKAEKKLRDGLMQQMSAAEINDSWMHIDWTRSTTSRHAAMVKSAFNRARNPQRV